MELKLELGDLSDSKSCALYSTPNEGNVFTGALQETLDVKHFCFTYLWVLCFVQEDFITLPSGEKAILFFFFLINPRKGKIKNHHFEAKVYFPTSFKIPIICKSRCRLHNSKISIVCQNSKEQSRNVC